MYNCVTQNFNDTAGRQSWTGARSFCRSQGGDLVTITDPGQEDFIRRNVLAADKYVYA